ncbi:hypothetical protein [Reinekea blandensis]|uniref:Uncharacterized protein n=1 Tax=Reinekea blandensis MED297 TaxID=314283 RepID=A4BJ71_9GAMM|nr:hypothetical protein [Reinekea blandensis]EAR07824.1 hypothetical protein MED297_05249 [Reinekea sp. MED297] [Reinekea blandensis MED297]
MELVHWLSAPVLVFADHGDVLYALSWLWGLTLLLLPVLLPMATSTSLKFKRISAISWLTPWCVLWLYWMYRGSQKGIGNVFLESISTLVISSVVATIFFLFRRTIGRAYYGGAGLSCILVLVMSMVTPYLGK